MIELSLASILANIVTEFGNTELNYISDFRMPGTLHGVVCNLCNIILLQTEQSNLLAELANRDIPIWQYELSVLRNRQEEEFLPQVCPIFETRYLQPFPHWFIYFLSLDMNIKFYVKDHSWRLQIFQFCWRVHCICTAWKHFFERKRNHAHLEASQDYIYLGCQFFNIRSDQDFGWLYIVVWAGMDWNYFNRLSTLLIKNFYLWWF